MFYMLHICRDCQHIGLGDYDRERFNWAAPLLRSSMMLVALSCKDQPVSVMNRMVLLCHFAIYHFIESATHKDSCPECKHSRSMVPVYSPEGQELIMLHEIDFPYEKITIEVIEPS